MNQDITETQEIRLTGIPVSPGIAFGYIKVHISGSQEPESYDITEADIPGELVRFHRALLDTTTQISRMRDRMKLISGEKEAAIFDAHMMFLQDKSVISKVEKLLSTRLKNVEFVYYVVMQDYIEVLRRLDDPYFRARTGDMEDVMQRVIKNLTQIEPLENLLNNTEREEDEDSQILMAYDLTPSDTAAMDAFKIRGFATETGSTVSHTAILARSMGIPAIVGIEHGVLKVECRAFAIIDGYKGVLVIKPTDETIQYYKRIQSEKEKAYKKLEALRDLPTETKDGRKIRLSGNVEFPHEYSAVKEVGAEGVGLFRTEFFLLGNRTGMPDEEEQYNYYRELAEGCAPHGVIFRTLDAGGDKLPSEKLDAPEPNPFLGWRGIRVSLTRKSIFKKQLRAILRATVGIPKCGVMFPMISGYTEVMQAKAVLQECRDELEAEGIPYDKNLRVGIMIEVPSAALMTDVLAKEVDFFSVGTNDLTQYTIAVDRVNNKVANLFRSTHPAVGRLINMTVQAGEREGIPTAICGEMAGDILLMPLLIGLGAVSFSVGVHLVPVVRYAIRNLNYEECRAMAQEALASSNSRDIVNLSTALAKKSYPILFE